MSSTSPSLRWTIAVLLCLSTALNYLDRQVLSILATTIQKDLGIDDIGYAKITTYFLLSYTIMYAVSGRLVDFLGTRLSLAWAVAGWSVAGMLHGAANSVAQLSLCRFILGTFEAANFPAGAKAVSEWFPLKERALGMGLFASGGALGAVIAFPMVTWLALSYCKSGRGNLCRHTIMLGSASTTPPTDGAFAEFVTVRADQCHILPPSMDDATAAMLEPFAVALHAVKRAGTVAGKRVLVTGGGPIGLLVAMTARMFGAAPVALSDILASRRETALKLGADVGLNPTDPHLADVVRGLTGDGFDVVFEASGAKAALRQAFNLVRPGGTIVQIGTLGTEDIPLPANQLMVREINFIGSMRYGNVFDEAIRLVQAGRIDLRPLISGVLPLAEATEAMRLAGDKTNALKVQLEIN